MYWSIKSYTCSIDSSNDVTKNEQMLDIGGGEEAIRVFKFSSTNPDF